MYTNKTMHLAKAALSISMILFLLLSGVSAYAEEAVQAVRDVIRASGDVPQGSGTYSLSASNNVLSLGQTAQAVIAGDTSSIAQVFWTSGNEDLLVVERDGFLRCTGVQQSDTPVTVSATVLTWDGQSFPVSGQFTVQGNASQGIDAKAPASLTASEAFLRDTLFLYPGEVFALSPTLPVGSQISQYTNTNPQAALLRENGDIEAKTPGETVVTLDISGSSAQQVAVRVTVLDAFNRESAGPRPSISRMTLWQGEKITPVFVGEQSLTWTSANPAVATVAADGTITAVGEGSTLVTLATADNAFKSGIYIDVPGVEFTGLSATALTPSTDGSYTLELKEGESITLDMLFSPDFLKNALYTSESNNAAAVAASGLTLTAQMGKAGETASVIVMAATKQGLVTRVIHVTVIPGDRVVAAAGRSGSSTKLVLTPSVMTIEVNEKRTVSASYSPSGNTADVTYASSNSNIATVDGDGLVTGISEGSVTITARTTDGRYEATCVVTVVRYTITSLSMSPAALTMDRGELATMTAFVQPADAKYSLQFSSSNPNIVLVNATNSTQAEIKAVGKGTATITVTDTYTGKTASSMITVMKRAEKVDIYEKSFGIVTDLEGTFDEGTVLSTLSRVVTPSDADIKTVVWSSSNPKVATVDKDTGVVTLVGIGKSDITVTVTSYDGSKVSASFTIISKERVYTAKDVTRIVIERAETKNVVPTSVSMLMNDRGDTKAQQNNEVTLRAVAYVGDKRVEYITGFEWTVADTKLVGREASNKYSDPNCLDVWGLGDKDSLTSLSAAQRSTTIIASLSQGGNVEVKSKPALQLLVEYDVLDEVTIDDADLRAKKALIPGDGDANAIAGATKNATLKLTYKPKKGGVVDPDDLKTSWTSSASTVAKVDKDTGVLSFEGGGDGNNLTGYCNITANVKGYANVPALPVAVDWDQVASFTLDKQVTPIQVGHNDTIIARPIGKWNGYLSIGMLSGLSVKWDWKAQSIYDAKDLHIAHDSFVPGTTPAARDTYWVGRATPSAPGAWDVWAMLSSNPNVKSKGGDEVIAESMTPSYLRAVPDSLNIVYHLPRETSWVYKFKQPAAEWVVTDYEKFSPKAADVHWKRVDEDPIGNFQHVIELNETTGEITPVGVGTAKISVTSTDFPSIADPKNTAYVLITVRYPKVDEVRFKHKVSEGYVGEGTASNDTLEVELGWEEGSKAGNPNAQVQWSLIGADAGKYVAFAPVSSPPNNTKMDLLYKYAVGNPTIRAWVDESFCTTGMKYDEFTMEVKWPPVDVEAVVQSPANREVAVGSTATIKVTVTAQRGTLKGSPHSELTWLLGQNSAFSFTQIGETELSADEKTATLYYSAKAEHLASMLTYTVKAKDSSAQGSVELASYYTDKYLVLTPSSTTLYLSQNGGTTGTITASLAGAGAMDAIDVVYTWTITEGFELVHFTGTSLNVTKGQNVEVKPTGADTGKATLQVVATDKNTGKQIGDAVTHYVFVKLPTGSLDPTKTTGVEHLTSHSYVGCSGTLGGEAIWDQATPPDANNKVTWSVSNNTVASINENTGDYKLLSANPVTFYAHVGKERIEVVTVTVAWDDVVVELSPQYTAAVEVDSSIPFIVTVTSKNGGTIDNNPHAVVKWRGEMQYFGFPDSVVPRSYTPDTTTGEASFNVKVLDATGENVLKTYYATPVGGTGAFVSLSSVRKPTRILVTGAKNFDLNVTSTGDEYTAKLMADNVEVTGATYQVDGGTNVVVDSFDPATGKFFVKVDGTPTSDWGSVTVTATHGSTTISTPFYFRLVRPTVDAFAIDAGAQGGDVPPGTYIAHPSAKAQMSVNSASVRWKNGTGTLSDAVISWRSSDNSVASVSSNGMLTLNRAGTADITATIDGRSASQSITVKWDDVKFSGTAPFTPSQASSSSLGLDVTPYGRSVLITAQVETVHGGYIRAEKAVQLQNFSASNFSLYSQTGFSPRGGSDTHGTVGFVVESRGVTAGAGAEQASIDTASGYSANLYLKSGYGNLSVSISNPGATVTISSEQYFKATVNSDGVSLPTDITYEWSFDPTNGDATVTSFGINEASVTLKAPLAQTKQVKLKVTAKSTSGGFSVDGFTIINLGGDPTKTLAKISASESLVAGGADGSLLVRLSDVAGGIAGTLDVSASSGVTVVDAAVATDADGYATIKLSAPVTSATSTSILVKFEDALCLVTIPIVQPDPAGVSIGGGPLVGLAIDEEPKIIQLSAVPTWAGGITNRDPSTYTVSWSSSNPNIASVDANGNVLILRAGNALITVTVTSKTNNRAVTDSIHVQPAVGAAGAPYAGLAANVANEEGKIEEGAGVVVFVGSEEDGIWSAPGEQKLGRVAEGVFRPVGTDASPEENDPTGTQVIKVTLTEEQQAALDATEEPQTENDVLVGEIIWDNLPTEPLIAGQTPVQTTIRLTAKNGETLPIRNKTYSSSDDSIVGVGGTGLIVPIAKGTATIYVTVNNGGTPLTASHDIVVLAAPEEENDGAEDQVMQIVAADKETNNGGNVNHYQIDPADDSEETVTGGTWSSGSGSGSGGSSAGSGSGASSGSATDGVSGGGSAGSSGGGTPSGNGGGSLWTSKSPAGGSSGGTGGNTGGTGTWSSPGSSESSEGSGSTGGVWTSK